MLKNNKSINNPHQKKREQKHHPSNTIIAIKNTEISKKLNIIDKHKKRNEKKGLNISAKEIKNNSKEKDNKYYLNCISRKKKTIHKQTSFISKISKENLHSTIDNEHKKNNYKSKGRHLSIRSSDKKIKKDEEKRINLENYVKEKESKKHKQKIITKSNQISIINNKKNKEYKENILDIKLTSLSPKEKIKNKKKYKI